MITLNVNGKTLKADAEADTPLLWVLRDSLHLTAGKLVGPMIASGGETDAFEKLQRTMPSGPGADAG